jgi:hypothetical protein
MPGDVGQRFPFLAPRHEPFVQGGKVGRFNLVRRREEPCRVPAEKLLREQPRVEIRLVRIDPGVPESLAGLGDACMDGDHLARKVTKPRLELPCDDPPGGRRTSLLDSALELDSGFQKMTNNWRLTTND